MANSRSSDKTTILITTGVLLFTAMVITGEVLLALGGLVLPAVDVGAGPSWVIMVVAAIATGRYVRRADRR